MANVKMVDSGVVVLTTDLKEGEPSFVFSGADFDVLKFTKRKIDKAPNGYYVKIEHAWKNGRKRTEYLAFAKFRENYLINHLPIFLERGATLSIAIGLFEGDAFTDLSNNSIFSFPSEGQPTKLTHGFKDFKVKLYYELYSL